jgi:GNAT superfamily N-acetyltransferase
MSPDIVPVRRITIALPGGRTLVVRALVAPGNEDRAAAFAAAHAKSAGKSSSKAQLTGGHWITIERKDGGGYRRLYIKGKGKSAHVLAGGGATPGHPKTIGQAISGEPGSKPGTEALRGTKPTPTRAVKQAARSAERQAAARQVKTGPARSSKATNVKKSSDAAAKPALAKQEGHSPGSDLPEHGPSKARVTHHDYTEDEVHAEAKQVFGRKVSTQEIASAVGAPDDSHVNIAPSGDGGLRVQVSGTGYRADRTITTDRQGKVVIDNHQFYVEAEHQGKGIGARVFGRQVEQASRLGVDRIVTYGAGMKGSDHNGYSTWAKFGYDGELGVNISSYIKSGKAPSLPAEIKNPKRISDFMTTKEGRQWWTDNGQGQEMEFSLKEGSYSRRQWDAYRREKAAKAK